MIKNFKLVFYYLIASRLPSSFFPLGKFFNYIRIRTLKGIIKLGDSNSIQNNIYVGKGENIVVGSNCQINENVKLDNVLISDYVMIAPGVTILGKMHEHSQIDLPMILQGEKEVRQTLIEDDVWIGTNAIIMPGLKIKKGCIIAAGAVLTKDTEPFGIYAGIPARMIRKRQNKNTKE